MSFTHANIVSILVAAVAAWIFGGIYYTGLSKWWMAAQGKTLEQCKAEQASKSAVAGLTRALAVEWSRHGITVNAIAPGVFETDLNRQILKGARGQEFLMRTPMGRFGRVEELVGAAVYLASDAATFVTGQMIAVDGGFLASGVNQ